MTGLSDRTVGAVLLDLATALALITALVYATGWTYAYHYFGHFELGLLMLEIPYQYFLMYGFWVFKDWWWLLALLYAFVGALYFVPALRFRLRWLGLERPWMLKQAQVLIVLLAFLLTWWMAAALYRNLFGKLDQRLKHYDTLYLAPDGFLNLLAFARLVTPEGQYWIQRQSLREVATGRHLIAGYDRDLDKPKGLLTLGGVDYDAYSKTVPAKPTEKPPQTDPA